MISVLKGVSVVLFDLHPADVLAEGEAPARTKEQNKSLKPPSPVALSLIWPLYPNSFLSLLSQAGNVKIESPSLGRESCSEGTEN